MVPTSGYAPDSGDFQSSAFTRLALSAFCLATPEGIDPPPPRSKRGVLPLYDGAIYLVVYHGNDPCDLFRGPGLQSGQSP